jgi:hypothetical protein
MEPEPAQEDRFLNVLKPALDSAETLPPMKKIDEGDSFGAEIQAGGSVYRVLFSKDALEAPKATRTP